MRAGDGGHEWRDQAERISRMVTGRSEAEVREQIRGIVRTLLAGIAF